MTTEEKKRVEAREEGLSSAPATSDPYNLKRFVTAQEGNKKGSAFSPYPVFLYADAYKELTQGHKGEDSHYMWFIFPQFKGLGASRAAEFFAIQTIDEAKAFLAHELLGERLRECTKTLCKLEGATLSTIFPVEVDRKKFRSCMELFIKAARNSDEEAIFKEGLRRYPLIDSLPEEKTRNTKGEQKSSIPKEKVAEPIPSVKIASSSRFFTTQNTRRLGIAGTFVAAASAADMGAVWPTLDWMSTTVFASKEFLLPAAGLSMGLLLLVGYCYLAANSQADEPAAEQQGPSSS